MSKGLEALKIIRHIHDMECGKDNSIDKDFDTIETELKALEIIKKMFNDGNYLIRFNGHSCYIWDNVLMATSCEITKEEYDLLKEVLL